MEIGDDEGCQQLVDGPGCSPCGKPITHVVHERYTPAAFAIECCDDCADSLIRYGYFEKKPK